MKFSGRILKLGINAVIDPPQQTMDLLFERAGRNTSPIPVRGWINGTEFMQTLVKFRGAWRLYVNGRMLKHSGLAVGDTATVELHFDPDPRDVPVPAALEAAFRKSLSARAAFDRLTPSRRKDILRYIGSLKRADAIRKNVERVIGRLQDS